MPKRIKSRKSPRRSSKRTPRRSSKRSPRRSSKRSPRRVSRKMSRRTTPCSKVGTGFCESQMDSRGLRRCRINVKSRRCETLPMKFRARATAGIKTQAPKNVGRLSPERLAPYTQSPKPRPLRTVGRLSPAQLAPFQKK